MIRKAALALIHWYWNEVREEDRRVCLYRVSCSHHVHDMIIHNGWISGARCFLLRMKTCKPGYRIEQTRDGIYLVTSNGKHILEQDMNPLLVKELKSNCIHGSCRNKFRRDLMISTIDPAKDRVFKYPSPYLGLLWLLIASLLTACWNDEDLVDKNFPDEFLVRDYGCTRAPMTVELLPPLLPNGYETKWIFENGSESTSFSQTLEFSEGGSQFVELEISKNGQVEQHLERVIEALPKPTYVGTGALVLDIESSYWTSPRGDWYNTYDYWYSAQDTSGRPDITVYVLDEMGEIKSYGGGFNSNIPSYGITIDFGIDETEAFALYEEFTMVLVQWVPDEVELVSDLFNLQVLDQFQFSINPDYVEGDCELRYPEVVEHRVSDDVAIRMRVYWP